MPIVHGLNVQFTTDTFSGGLVETFMADAHFCGAGRVPGAAIGHRESVPIKTWLQNCKTRRNIGPQKRLHIAVVAE